MVEISSDSKGTSRTERRLPIRRASSGYKGGDCALEIGGDLYSLNYGSPDVYMRLDRALLSTGKPVIVWGASIGPFTKDPRVEDQMKEHLSRLTLICARGSETVSYLESLGIGENVRRVADPGFVMPATEPSLSEELLHFISKRPIGLNLSPLIGRYRSKYESDQWIKEAGACIGRLVASDMAPVLLVPHVMVEGDNGYEFLVAAVESGPGWSDRLCVLPPTLTAAKCKWAISKLRGFIGARTHSTIAALSSAVPTISIGYSMKARGINKDIFGHLDWMIAANDLSPLSLLAKAEKLLSNEQSIREELERKKPEFVERTFSAADYAAKMLEN